MAKQKTITINNLSSPEERKEMIDLVKNRKIKMKYFWANDDTSNYVYKYI